MDKFDVSSPWSDGGIHYTVWLSRVSRERQERKFRTERAQHRDIMAERKEARKLKSTGVENHKGEATRLQGGWKGKNTAGHKGRGVMKQRDRKAERASL
jgi:hypothetical protein